MVIAAAMMLRDFAAPYMSAAFVGLQRKLGFASGVSVARLAAALSQRVNRLEEKAYMAKDIAGRYIRSCYETPRASVLSEQHRRLFPFTMPPTYGAGRQLLMPPTLLD